MKSNFAQRWLTIICQTLTDTNSAIFVMPDSENQALQTLAKWPEDLSELDDFTLIIQYVLAKNEHVSVLNVQQADKSLCDFFAQPVFFKSELLGFIVIKVKTLPKERHLEIFNLLQQSTQWFELTDNNKGQTNDFYASVIGLLAACIEQKSYREALIGLVTEITASLNCEQVAIGEFENQHSKIVALSNSAQFDDRSNFIQKIADAMDEAIEQDSLILYPDSQSSLIQRAHQELARKFGSGAMLTIPLMKDQSVFGAITLLRSEESPFDAETAQLCKLSISLLSPFLALKKAEEQSLFSKIIATIKLRFAGLLGFKHLKKKLAIASLFGLFVTAALLKGEFKLTADAVLEGKMQRVVAAPIEGFLLSASVRAGDTVREGNVMATLDDSDLKLELSKLNGQLQKFRREYREALSTNDLVKVSVISAQIDQATAEMELTKQQLQKIVLTAPFDSVVIEGDLSQMLGSPVERGDMLFKIAPLEGYRIILKVDESLIS
jgi:Biotin-lipoyl like/GAF domain